MLLPFPAFAVGSSCERYVLMVAIDSGALDAVARSSPITVRAKTAAPAHAITQLSPSSTTFWSSPRIDQSDPAGKTFVTSPTEGMSGTEPGCSGPGISRSPKTTGPASGVNLCGRRGGSLARAACDQARHRPLEQRNGFDRQLDAAVAKGFGEAFRRVHKRRTAVAMAE